MAAFADFKAKNYFEAFNAMGLVVEDAKADLATCENMQDDIAAVENWAKIFTQPVTLAETMAKNWIKHNSVIEADIKSMELDWEASSFFHSGIDVADAMTMLIGPVIM